MRDGLVRAWKGQPDPELWRRRCEEGLRGGLEEKWEEADREIEGMLASLEPRVLAYGLSLERRGALGGAVDFAVIRQEIEELPDRPGGTVELIEMIGRGSGEDEGEIGAGEAMDIDSQPNDQRTEEADVDCIGGDEEEELIVLDDEVSDDDDLADVIEMVSLSDV